MRQLPTPHEATVRRRTGSTSDEWGNAVHVYAEHPIRAYGVAPGPAPDLAAAQREGVNIAWTMFLPKKVDVREHDQIRWAGTWFDIEGIPRDWSYSPFGATAPGGVVVELKAVSG